MISRIASRNYTVIDSGSSFLYDTNADIDFTVETEDVPFTVRLKFIKDDNSEHLLRKVVMPDNNLIEIICTNFNNPLGTGTTVPIELAKVNGKAIKLHFWAFILGTEENGARRVDYTFFLED